MSDIEAMFHQVRVPEEDADLLRFLWWPNGDFSQCIVKYRMVVHLFGATSSPSCANFAPRRCAEDNKELFSQQVFETIMHMTSSLLWPQKRKLCACIRTFGGFVPREASI